MRALFVVKEFANSWDANLHSPNPGREITKVLLAIALSKTFTILFSDVCVAFMNKPTLEGDPVYMEPPASLDKHNNTVWCFKRPLTRLRDAFRLFHEHFSAVLTSRLGFIRSKTQPTLFVDLARKVFIAVRR